ncbi:hypothetical protein [Bifidobacterium felsineum]|uniref:hypothetical protein n=1 Tax=Bifidobacterium felsineum TaxID=2045440 RepID=UPI001BDBDF13|nr:hypothetical protein [Bifidobacterium felsineum]MBT1164607.1 hypothetical protein [Bifidobacterium felsineum]
MTRPLVFLDFDGVVNQFPDPKVRRRQNSVTWMKPDDPRRNLYDPNEWLIPDRKARPYVPDHGRIPILWNQNLVNVFDGLDADIMWLSTWQPHTNLLNMELGVTWPTVRWYDPITRNGILTGKRRTILAALRQDRPIVWVDDEETTYEAGLAIESTPREAPILAIRPDAHIGVSRSQLDAIRRFTENPPIDASVRFDVNGSGHREHWGF